MIQKLIKFDKNIFVKLNSLGDETFDGFWMFVTEQIHWIPLFVFVMFLIVRNFGWKKGVFTIVFMIILASFMDISTNFVKDFFQRLRPNNDPSINTFIRILKHPQSYSFYSGHASNSMSFSVFAFLLFYKKYRYFGFIFAWPLIFGFSRIYLGVHFPLDITIGYLAGTVISTLFYFIAYKPLISNFFNNNL